MTVTLATEEPFEGRVYSQPSGMNYLPIRTKCDTVIHQSQARIVRLEEREDWKQVCPWTLMMLHLSGIAWMILLVIRSTSVICLNCSLIDYE